MGKSFVEMTDLEIIEMIKYNQSIGKGDTETGKEYGVSREIIRDYRRKFNIDKSILEEYKQAEEMNKVDTLKSILDKCIKIEEVVKITGMPKHIVTKLMKKYDLSFSKKVYCLECGKEIVLGNNRKAKLCSSQCRETYKNKNRVSICKNCGKSFKGYRTHCSEECKRNALLKCKICGKSFHGFHTEKFCSSECREENDKILYNEYRNREIEVECEVCGKTMIVKESSKKQRICSLKCRSKFLDYKVNKSLEDLFGTADEQEIKKIVRGKLNEKAC